MKRLILVITFVCILGGNLLCQEKGEDRNITIQTYFFLSHPWDGNGLFGMDVEGQYALNDIFNVSFTVSFCNENSTHSVYSSSGSYEEEWKENIFQIAFKPMLVYRPLKTGIRGFYLKFYPKLGWRNYNGKVNALYTEIGLGFDIGWKWVFKNGFTLQLGSGIGRTWSVPEKSDDFSSKYSDGRIITLKHFDILLDFKLGYSFKCARKEAAQPPTADSPSMGK